MGKRCFPFILLVYVSGMGLIKYFRPEPKVRNFFRYKLLFFLQIIKAESTIDKETTATANSPPSTSKRNGKFYNYLSVL